MIKTVLIHGYATGLEVLPIRERLGEDAGFLAFREQIARGETRVFRWSVSRRVPLHEAASAQPYHSLYEEERARTKDPSIHAELDQYLQTHQPKTIVCHSLGCVLFWDYLEKGRLPISLKNVVFVQADLPARPKPLPTDIVPLFSSGAIGLHNLSCPWDPTLLLSSAVHHQLRAGLIGLRVPHAQNRRFPLWRPWNLHTSSIRDPKLIEWIARLS